MSYNWIADRGGPDGATGRARERGAPGMLRRRWTRKLRLLPCGAALFLGGLAMPAREVVVFLDHRSLVVSSHRTSSTWTYLSVDGGEIAVPTKLIAEIRDEGGDVGSLPATQAPMAAGIAPETPAVPLPPAAEAPPPDQEQPEGRSEETPPPPTARTLQPPPREGTIPAVRIPQGPSAGLPKRLR